MSYKKIIFILCVSIFLSTGRNVNAQHIVDTFKYTGAITTFTVPTCVSTLTVEADGAQGGATGGLGAKVIGTFNYSSGTVLSILVGGAGGSNDNAHGSGGGGSFVVLKSNDTIVVIGGGGGGHGSGGIDATSGGSGTRIPQTPSGAGTAATTGGGGAAGSGAAGGIGCNIGSPAGGSTWAAGGGGFCGNGGLYNSNATLGGYAFTNGGAGGPAAAAGGDYVGGFGGGGGCGDRGAGGGGYAGGAGGTNNSLGGGGGSSYNAGTNQTNTTGVRSGNGIVVITWAADSVGSAQSNIYIPIVCAGQGFASACISVNNGPAGAEFNYAWVPSGGSRDTATGLTAGNYTVTVSSGCNAKTATVQVTITQPGFLTASPFTTNMNCNGQIASGIANPGISGGAAPFTYLWAPSGLTTATIGGLSFTTYSLSVTDNHGCKTTALLTVTQPNPLVITASSVIPVTCSGGKNGVAVSNVTGGTSPYMYAWAPSGGSNASANGLSAGVYTLNITDSKGCTGAGLITVSQPPALAVVVSPLLNIACNGDNNGVLGAGVDGGVRPYAYAWTGGGGNDSNASNLSAGIYAVTVTDANGCITKVNGTITQPAVLGITIDTTLNSGYCTGSAWVVLAGGTPPYNYSWSNGSTNFFQDSLCDGLYCCTVTDAHGCITNTCAHIGTSLGIGNITSGSTPIKIYPNPSNGQFAIQSSAGDKSIVVIYNVLGEKVYTSELNSGGNTVINISSQPVGIYLYRVISSVSGSELGEGKIVLQK